MMYPLMLKKPREFAGLFNWRPRVCAALDQITTSIPTLFHSAASCFNSYAVRSFLVSQSRSTSSVNFFPDRSRDKLNRSPLTFRRLRDSNTASRKHNTRDTNNGSCINSGFTFESLPRCARMSTASVACSRFEKPGISALPIM